MTGPGGAPAPAATPQKRVARAVAPPPAPVVAPPAPKQYVVETIRAAQRKEETLR